MTQWRRQRANYRAVIIILAGALIGSLFVDVVQLWRGEGFTYRALRTTSVVEYDGRTWVAYDEPAVTATIITRDPRTCDDTSCTIGALTAWLRYTLPTVRTQRIAIHDAAPLIARTGAPYVPAVIFAPSVRNTRLFDGAPELFASTADGTGYIFDVPFMGVRDVRYMRAPRSPQDDARIVLVARDGTATALFRRLAAFAVPMSVILLPPKEDDAPTALRALLCAADMRDVTRIVTRRYGIAPYVRDAACADDPATVERADAILEDVRRFGTLSLPAVFVDGDLVREKTTAQIARAVREKLRSGQDTTSVQ